MGSEKRDRVVRLMGALVVMGGVISGLMLPSATPVRAAGTALKSYSESLPNSVVKVDMVPIPGGTIKIGGKAVTVKPFYMEKTETPWEVYDVFLGSGQPSAAYDQTEFPPDAIALPSKSYILPDLGWGHEGYPVINVSSMSVDMFTRWMRSVTKKKYRLPTEAEWEFACRAGVTGPVKMDKATLNKIAWFANNSNGTTHPVGKKAPNKFGLYDMYGNTGEWATDLKGKFVLCGGTHRDGPPGMIPNLRRYFSPKWQETDPQIPKSRWWLADGRFIGVRLVCEP
jgi:formylglycine-generating enzyme required for sulfatase activity